MLEIGKTYGTEIKIQIDAIDKEKQIIFAGIVFINDFWKSRLQKDLLNHMIVLEKPIADWIVTAPNDFPWFILNEQTETFEHYR